MFPVVAVHVIIGVRAVRAALAAFVVDLLLPVLAALAVLATLVDPFVIVLLVIRFVFAAKFPFSFVVVSFGYLLMPFCEC